MGCSPDGFVSPAEIAEEKRRARAQKLIRQVHLSELTIGDLLDVVGVFRPAYPMHVWDSRDTDVLVEILKRVDKWHNH